MQLLKRFWPSLVILGVITALFATNYQPSTYLSGWDNLQTDLNPFLGVKRAFMSVWQEYQSLGLVAGMGHAADLVRATTIWLLSFILPSSLLRYSFHFLMLLSGALGMLQLLQQLGFNKEKRKYALAGALFYIFNFAITQMMFFPFEPFSVFVGLLPWEIWIFIKVISSKVTRRDWLAFGIINILATPQAVAQQLFVVYCMLLGLITLGEFLQSKSKLVLKNAILSLILILSINSFWLLPQLYFLTTSGSVVKEAKINQLATSDVFYANKDKGTISSFSRFEGFFYDRVDQNQQPLFEQWKKHRTNPIVLFTIYLLSLLSLIGVFFPSRARKGFVFCLILVGLSLLSSMYPLNLINDFIRENSFINQIFRSPFTKFSIPFALIAAYFFTVTLARLDKLMAGSKKALTPVLALGLILIAISTLPSFKGQSISPVMQVKFPAAYSDLTTYFKTIDKNKRIGLLPEYTFWGWYHYRWGYDGSGFLWYGIEQPIISRTFDVWSLSSESYFWELKNALEAEDTQGLQNVFEKYSVDYVLFDKSLLPIVSSTKGIQYQSIQQLLAKTKNITKEKEFGFLTLYKIQHSIKSESFVSIATNMPNVGPGVKLTNLDTAYADVGAYLTTDTRPLDRYYPFLDLTTQTQLADKNWNITEYNSSWTITAKLSPGLSLYHPTLASEAAMDLYRDNKAIKYVLPLTTKQTGDALSISFPKNTLDDFVPANANVTSCSTQYDGLIRTEVIDKDLQLIARSGATGCFSFSDESLDQRYGYLVSIKHTNDLGQPFFFYVLDKTKDQAYVEDRLTQPEQTYILGSKFEGGLGYSLTFQSTSLPNVPALNTLKGVSIDLLPYNELREAYLEKSKGVIPRATFIKNFKALKTSYYHYDVSTQPLSTNTTTLILHQSYSSGWHAYELPSNAGFFKKTFPFVFAKPLNHIEVNNWENGWTVPSQKMPSIIIIIFLPQYLEYIGFAVLTIIAIVGTILYARPRHKLDKNEDSMISLTS